MTEGPQAGGSPFEAIDPKLNVFALANGMDLEKADSLRRLSWFLDGLERGLEVRSAGAGAYSITAQAWKIKSPEERTSAPVSEATPLAELMAALEAAIEDANAL